jgi:hypothetical protein
MQLLPPLFAMLWSPRESWGQKMAFRNSLAGVIAVVLLAGSAAACSDMRADVDSEVVNSVRYDQVPCKALMGRRDALVKTYGSPEGLPADQQPGVRPILKQQPTGLFPVPDLRSTATRDRKKAYGKIEAMDRSINRRQCGSPKAQQKGGFI